MKLKRLAEQLNATILRPFHRKQPSREEKLQSLAAESELVLTAQILRLLAPSMCDGTRFLRVRLPFGGSCL